MKEFKGTKAPWVVKPAKNMSYYIDGNTGNANEDVANIRLIASAPEMLTMLIEIVEARRIGNEIPIMEIESVINKAIGE